ncbi:MAG: CoB--CoM heterodisulfide reductase iron-sulfur subunit A family protein [Candidatus Sulfopaludibacter sp.]|nr:CoB--CoM heterodisulfide reductase iron-sulfur subunit A family protein [Candidatus Sulfopaludibacter sp.]
MSANSPNPVLIIGGGIAGLTAAVELADTGVEVVLVEKSASLGGRVARLHQYFPKLCPPTCGLEMHYRRVRENAGITVLTLAEVTGVTGSAGDYEVEVRVRPRFVSEACTLCGDCERVCPAERPDEFNYGLGTTKAAYLPHGVAYPAAYAIDRAACPEGCKACEEACKYQAIRLNAQTEVRTVKASAIVAATGWKPYDAAKLEHLGFGQCRNVVTNVMLERMAAADGPTAGRILRPSDGKEPRTVAFVQCAGSRDENHLPYCSAVCCTASLKHAAYIRALYPETAITIFYIDVRTPGRLEEFGAKVQHDADVRMVKGKVARVEENPATGDLLVTAEDVLANRKSTEHFELVVLATGIVPETEGLPAALKPDECGFAGKNGSPGIYAAGCVCRPAEVSATVQDATGTALKALQCANRSVSHVR